MYLSRLLTAIWLFGLLGTGGELLLLEHFEDVWQLVPLVLIGLGFVTSGWYLRRPGPSSLRSIRATLVLFALSGALGLFLHYRGNVEFEKELSPSLRGIRLFAEAVTGATPALAPGSMILLALIGFAWTVAERGTADRTRAAQRS